MTLKLQPVSQHIAVTVSALLLGFFLMYYLWTTYLAEKNDLEKEVKYLFVNAFKSEESQVLDQIIFDLKGVSILNQAEPILKEVRQKKMERQQDTCNIIPSSIQKAAVMVLSSRTEHHTTNDTDVRIKLEVKADTNSLDTIEALEKLQLTSNIQKVEQRFIEQLKHAKLNIDYHIQKDTVHHISAANQVYKDVFTNENYYISTEGNLPYLLQQMWPEILFSLLLYIVVLASFFHIIQAGKKRKIYYDMKEDFMRNMTHELKTPIATIGVALEAIQNFHAGQDETIRKEYYRIAEKENNKLNALVDKVLSISQNIDMFSYGIEKVQLPALIDEVVFSFKWRAEQTNVRLTFINQSTTPEVVLDAQNLVMILHNLIDNALKYNDHKSAVVKVTLTESQKYFNIEVFDNGSPIPLEYQKKIFEKFYRIPQGNIHSVKGHGLGLYMVIHLAQSLGATIQYSNSMDGNCFGLSIPKMSPTS